MSIDDKIEKNAMGFAERVMKWARKREVKKQNRPARLAEIDQAMADVRKDRLKAEAKIAKKRARRAAEAAEAAAAAADAARLAADAAKAEAKAMKNATVYVAETVTETVIEPVDDLPVADTTAEASDVTDEAEADEADEDETEDDETQDDEADEDETDDEAGDGDAVALDTTAGTHTYGQ